MDTIAAFCGIASIAGLFTAYSMNSSAAPLTPKSRWAIVAAIASVLLLALAIVLWSIAAKG